MHDHPGGDRHSQMRLSVPRSGGWRAWGAIRGEFERRLAEQESRTLKSRAIGWTELSTSSALVPWQVTFAPVLGRSRGRPATTMRHRRGPDPRPLSLCRSVRREDATTGTGHPGTAPGQVIPRGCHIHVVRATWLGHPRRNSGRRVRITSHGSTAECSSTRRQGPGRDPPVRDQRKAPAAEAAAAPAGPAREA